ncbi:MAG: hypothetical protein ABIJ21_00610 [Nanoarchaeota archaeon]
MTITIKEFRPIATPEQLQCLDRIMELASEEKGLIASYHTQVEEYNRSVDRERNRWGLEFRQIADLVVDQEYECERHQLGRNGKSVERRIRKIQQEMRGLFIAAVDTYGMGHLGFIQRYYDNLTKGSLPIR